MIHDEGWLETPRLNLRFNHFIDQLLLIKVVRLNVLLSKSLNLGKNDLSNFFESVFMAKYSGVDAKFSAHIILCVGSTKVILNCLCLVGVLARVFTPREYFRIYVKLRDEDLSTPKQLDCQLTQQVLSHRHQVPIVRISHVELEGGKFRVMSGIYALIPEDFP